jgi:hypothetical protein
MLRPRPARLKSKEAGYSPLCLRLFFVSSVKDSVKGTEWTLDTALPVVQKIAAIARELAFYFESANAT